MKYLEKPHIAQIFAKRKEVLSFRLPASGFRLAAFPVCIVYYRLFPYYGDKLHDFSLVVRYSFVTLPELVNTFIYPVCDLIVHYGLFL